MSCFAVCEAGVNHLGGRSKMLALCDAAKAVGATAIKFQAYNANKLIARRGITDEKTCSLLRAAELIDADLAAIAERCEAIGLRWFASVFDPAQVARVLRYGACALKIGHKEADYTELVDACAAECMTGMQLWISKTDGISKPSPANLVSYFYVHCVAEYPATSPPKLHVIRREYCPGDVSGFSSHYQDWRIPAAAALRGARYIEFHLKLSDTDPEATWSLSTEDAAKCCAQIREYEKWL